MFKHVRQLAGVAALTLAAQAAYADDDTIKVGVLHSLSGTMAISETTLKDTVLMMVEEQNKKGGLLGKKLEAVRVPSQRTRASQTPGRRSPNGKVETTQTPKIRTVD